MTGALCACFAVLASVGTACSKSVTTPTPATSSSVQLARLSITGNASFTAIGQTSQLMASATFSDGTVKDVSGDATWVSADPSIAMVSSAGLLTVVRLGATNIYAHYQTQSATVPVTITLPRTFVVFGSVNEPGQGGVIGMRVLDRASALSTQTGEGGRFDLVGLPTGQAHLRFEKDGYEPAELDAASTDAVDGRVQQVIRLTAGETVMPHRLAPNDLTYAVGAGERCFSCRLIRIVVPARGTLHLRLTWTVECPVTLGLWVGGQHNVPLDARSTEVNAAVVAGAGELIVYVDRASPSATACHMPFVLATSLGE